MAIWLLIICSRFLFDFLSECNEIIDYATKAFPVIISYLKMMFIESGRANYLEVYYLEPAPINPSHEDSHDL